MKYFYAAQEDNKITFSIISQKYGKIYKKYVYSQNAIHN